MMFLLCIFIPNFRSTTTEMDKMLKYLEGKLLLNLDADMFQLMEDIKELMEKGD